MVDQSTCSAHYKEGTLALIPRLQERHPNSESPIGLGIFFELASSNTSLLMLAKIMHPLWLTQLTNFFRCDNLLWKDEIDETSKVDEMQYIILQHLVMGDCYRFAEHDQYLPCGSHANIICGELSSAFPSATDLLIAFLCHIGRYL